MKDIEIGLLKTDGKLKNLEGSGSGMSDKFVGMNFSNFKFGDDFPEWMNDVSKEIYLKIKNGEDVNTVLLCTKMYHDLCISMSRPHNIELSPMCGEAFTIFGVIMVHSPYVTKGGFLTKNIIPITMDFINNESERIQRHFSKIGNDHIEPVSIGEGEWKLPDRLYDFNKGHGEITTMPLIYNIDDNENIDEIKFFKGLATGLILSAILWIGIIYLVVK